MCAFVFVCDFVSTTKYYNPVNSRLSATVGNRQMLADNRTRRWIESCWITEIRSMVLMTDNRELTVFLSATAAKTQNLLHVRIFRSANIVLVKFCIQKLTSSPTFMRPIRNHISFWYLSHIVTKISNIHKFFLTQEDGWPMEKYLSPVYTMRLLLNNTDVREHPWK